MWSFKSKTQRENRHFWDEWPDTCLRNRMHNMFRFRYQKYDQEVIIHYDDDITIRGWVEGARIGRWDKVLCIDDYTLVKKGNPKKEGRWLLIEFSAIMFVEFTGMVRTDGPDEENPRNDWGGN